MKDDREKNKENGVRKRRKWRETKKKKDRKKWMKKGRHRDEIKKRRGDMNENGHKSTGGE